MARGEVHLSVPVHSNESLRIGTLRSLLRDMNMSPTEFEQKLTEL